MGVLTRICGRCKGSRVIWSGKLNKLVRCPDCTQDSVGG